MLSIPFFAKFCLSCNLAIFQTDVRGYLTIKNDTFKKWGSSREFVGKLLKGIHQNQSSIKRQSGIIGRFAPFYSVCHLTAART